MWSGQKEHIVAFLFGMIVTAVFPPSATASTSEMRMKRMNACVKLLQKSDPKLQNNWRGSCNVNALVKEIDGGGNGPQNLLATIFASDRLPVNIDDAACTDATPPIAKSPKCGLGSDRLYPTLGAGTPIKIRVPGGACISVVPLLLTNKTDFACNAVQSRIACVDASYDPNTDRTKIVLSARQSGPSVTTTVEFGKNDYDKHKERLDELVTNQQFTLLPNNVGSTSVVEAVTKLTRAQEDKCNADSSHSQAECRTIGQYDADANMQEVMRRYRNPRRDSPRDVITEDDRKIIAFLKAAHIDQNPEQWILFLSTAANEVGLDLTDQGVTTYDPIYGLSDAVLGNSALSFGAHQIDLGANEDSELELFWKVIEAYQAAHPDPVLAKADNAQSCINLPLRLMTLGALSMTYETAPRLTSAFRSPEGVNEYNKRLQNYLNEEVAITGRKKGLFAHSMITRVLYSDLRNQSGSGSPIDTLVGQEGQVDLGSCASIKDAEDSILKKLILTKDSQGKDIETDFAIRYKNIKRIVRQRAPNHGLSNCS